MERPHGTNERDSNDTFTTRQQEENTPNINTSSSIPLGELTRLLAPTVPNSQAHNIPQRDQAQQELLQALLWTSSSAGTSVVSSQHQPVGDRSRGSSAMPSSQQNEEQEINPGAENDSSQPSRDLPSSSNLTSSRTPQQDLPDVRRSSEQPQTASENAIVGALLGQLQQGAPSARSMLEANAATEGLAAILSLEGGSIQPQQQQQVLLLQQLLSQERRPQNQHDTLRALLDHRARSLREETQMRERRQQQDALLELLQQRAQSMQEETQLRLLASSLLQQQQPQQQQQEQSELSTSQRLIQLLQRRELVSSSGTTAVAAAAAAATTTRLEDSSSSHHARLGRTQSAAHPPPPSTASAQDQSASRRAGNDGSTSNPSSLEALIHSLSSSHSPSLQTATNDAAAAAASGLALQLLRQQQQQPGTMGTTNAASSLQQLGLLQNQLRGIGNALASQAGGLGRTPQNQQHAIPQHLQQQDHLSRPASHETAREMPTPVGAAAALGGQHGQQQDHTPAPTDHQPSSSVGYYARVDEEEEKMPSNAPMPVVIPAVISTTLANSERFPVTLFRMLEETRREGNDDIISFTASGAAFEIRQPLTFETEILPRYFPHGKLNSFKRQLNLYGFRLLSHGPDAGAYSHPVFHQNNKSASEKIRRMK